jgi:purine-cytosine permease-like protein
MALWLIGYLILIWLGLIVDDYILTKRHVKMFKKVMDEELRKLKAEALSTPGGK